MDEFENLVADVFSRKCASRETLETLTSRWAMLILTALREGSYRFNALRRRVDGVSEKMLSQTLQALERDGMVLRVAESTIPPRVEYSLTPLGREVADHMFTLIEWAESHVPEVQAAREKYRSD